MRSSLFAPYFIVGTTVSQPPIFSSKRYMLSNEYKAICVKWSSCMTRGQTVRTVKSVRYIKKELHLQYWEFTEINTVKHTNQRGALHFYVLPESCLCLMHSERLHATEHKPLFRATPSTRKIKWISQEISQAKAWPQVNKANQWL